MRMEIIDWIDNTDIVSQLMDYLKMKSRSNHEDEVRRCADYAKNLLENVGLDVTLIETSGNPLVFGQKPGNPDYKSILIYGHYDVQPEGDLSLWLSPPFEPEVRGNKLYGRGSADNKGQHFAHIKALEYFQDHYPDQYDQLNIKFILDGDEERGSFSLAEVFNEYKSKLDADVMIVSDGPSLVPDKPTIVGSVRGILTFQITIQHNPEDLHSGNFGGLARSATNDMITLLSTMVDENGRCKIPGFYDRVKPPTGFEQDLLENLHPVIEKIQHQRGYTKARRQPGKSVYQQNQFWPTFNINGIRAGGVKKQRRTIIPAECVASIDCRLVPDMDSARIQTLITDYVTSWAEEMDCKAAVEIESEHAMETLDSSLDDDSLSILQEALEFGFESEAVLVPRLGGSLPLYLFPKYLDKNVFLVPYALPDENNHAPNENLDIPYFKSGIVASVKLFDLLTTRN